MDIQNLSKNPKVIMQDIYIHTLSTINPQPLDPNIVGISPAFPRSLFRNEASPRATRERQADIDPHFKQVDQLYVVLQIIILKENMFFFQTMSHSTLFIFYLLQDNRIYTLYMTCYVFFDVHRCFYKTYSILGIDHVLEN